MLEHEANLSTLAALSATISVKSDNNNTAINRHVQTDIVKGVSSNGATVDFEHSPIGAFQNLLAVNSAEIYFKDLSYFVQKPFSKSKFKQSKSQTKCKKHLHRPYGDEHYMCVVLLLLFSSSFFVHNFITHYLYIYFLCFFFVFQFKCKFKIKTTTFTK